MVCANAGIVNGLPFIGAVLNKFVSTKSCVVGVIVFDRMTTFFGISLKVILCLECFADSE